MPSGQFTYIAIAEIKISREDRQRRELTGIAELADSISRLGLIHPIVIDRSNTLVAGERRLTAARSLGWTSIQAQYADDLPREELMLIELEENTRREELPWQDRCEAMAKYHALRQEKNPEWRPEDTASALSVSHNTVSRDILLDAEIKKGNELISKASSITTARNVLARQMARQRADTVSSILATAPITPLLNIDFIEWLDSYDGPPFNFIHCDFPYGINFDKSPAQGKANQDRYPDSFDTYKKLIEALARVPVSESAHLLFWYSPVHHPFTMLELMCQGWIVQPRPLIWGKSDNSGILADPKRGPRFNYETAFMASKGDRLVVQSVGNIHWGPRSEGHPSAKPYDMLKHFFRMFVDSTTHMLDPTCGGATALQVAKDMGAARVLGLEVDQSFYEEAVRNFK